MAGDETNLVDTTSYLTPNFKHDVGQPPKQTAEQRLIIYVRPENKI